MTDNDMDWMDEELDRAEKLNESGKTFNNEAPKLVEVKKEPPRLQKNFFMQAKYIYAIEDLQRRLKRERGVKMPELIEKAVDDLLKSYGVDVNELQF